MKVRFNDLLAAGFMAFFVGRAVESVGTMPKVSGPYEWWLPIAVLVMMAVPYALGRFSVNGPTKDGGL